MRIGLMRDRVVLQYLVETRDSFGQMIQSWATMGTYWAQIRPLSGREVTSSGQTKAEVTHFVRLRYTGPIDATMRLRFGTRIFNIIDPRDIDERNREYQVSCQEILPPA